MTIPYANIDADVVQQLRKLPQAEMMRDLAGAVLDAHAYNPTQDAHCIVSLVQVVLLWAHDKHLDRDLDDSATTMLRMVPQDILEAGLIQAMRANPRWGTIGMFAIIETVLDWHAAQQVEWTVN